MPLPSSYSSSWGDHHHVYGAKRASIQRLLLDPVGGVTTYGPAIPVPGVQDFSLSFVLGSGRAVGANTALALGANVQAASGKLMMSAESVGAFVAVLGGTDASSGSSPTRSRSWKVGGGQSLPYFRLIVESSCDDDSSSSDVFRDIYKCKVTKFDFGSTKESFSVPGVEWVGIRRRSDNMVCELGYREQAAVDGGGGAGSGDDTRPYVVTTIPANGATDVPVNTFVLIDFSEPMAAATIHNEASYSVTVAGNPVGIQVIPDVLPFRLYLYPQAGSWDWETVYDFSVSAIVEDLAGNTMLANYVFSFETEPEQFAPIVVASSPVDDGLWSPFDPLEIQWDKVLSSYEAQDPGSYFLLDITPGPQYGTPLPFGVTYAHPYSTITPLLPLPSGSQVALGATSNIRDLGGRRIQPWAVNFETT